MKLEQKYDSKGRPMFDLEMGVPIKRFKEDGKGNIIGFDKEYWTDEQILGFMRG
jgi:hypothetical protein